MALACAAACLLLGGCADREPEVAPETDAPYIGAAYIDTSGFLHIANENMDTVDPQCTTEFYIVALNVFDRLVELHSDGQGGAVIEPSLAEWWEVSEDALTYRFRLRQGVTFSNGKPLTASDVRFTFERLLTNPKSVNSSLVIGVLGARELRDGKTDTLAGFREIDDYNFEIELESPYAAFLDCLSSPGASILDKETLYSVGGLFGVYDHATIGTGPFILKRWTVGKEMILTPNENCWSGKPRCPGVDIKLMTDAESLRLLYEEGELDILDLDSLGCEAEPFLHSERYRDSIRMGRRVGINYIALNQSVTPLNDVRVRKALQYAIDREVLLNAVYSGHGHVENGIFPLGLEGHNPSLETIPCDPELARSLLAEAGLADGFDLEISISKSAKQAMHDIAKIAAYYWESIGVRVTITELDDTEFLRLRRSGALACYTSGWTADYDDPDNFIYTFFGSREESRSRSICYGDEAVMARVRAARAIADEQQRVAEYQALERKIIQEDAAWIPLFSRDHYFALSSRVDGFEVPWNGWSFGFYRDIRIINRNR